MKKILFIIALLSYSLISCVKEVKVENEIKVEYDVNQRFVTDKENLLTPQQETELNQILSDYEQKTSVEMAILTTDNYEGYSDIAEYAFAVGEKWGVGKKDVDNGLMIIISKTNNENFVATGYGLEGCLTDADTKLMQDSIFLPNFKEGKYYEGLFKFVQVAQTKIGDEYTGGEKSPLYIVKGIWVWFWGLPWWIKVILLVVYIGIWIISPELGWFITLLPIQILSAGKFGGGKFGGGGSRS